MTIDKRITVILQYRGMNKKIVFTGSFLNYFIKSLLIMGLVILTLGLALPYLVYWQMKYFFTHLEIE